MKHARAYIMFEMIFALALLVTVIAAAGASIHSGYCLQNGLWEELAAHELAESVLERAMAGPSKLEFFDARPVEVAGMPALPALSVTLSCQPARGVSGLAVLHAAVSWKKGTGPLAGQPMRVERESRRRAEP